jgi:hypothetical protein
MEAFQNTVLDLVQVFVALGGIYFSVALVLNLAQAQLASATGDTIGHARALQQGIAMVILLSVAVSVKPLAGAIAPYFYGANFAAENVITDLDSAYEVWRQLANIVVRLAIGGGGTFLTINAVYSGAGIHLAKAAGMPVGMSQAVGKLGMAVGGGVLTLLSMVIANGLLRLIFQ